MTLSTRTRRLVGYVALVGGFLAGRALALFASSTVRDLRAYRLYKPNQDVYVLSFRDGDPGPEMNFHSLLALHVFLQWFGLAMMLVCSIWIVLKVRRAREKYTR